MRHNVAMLIMAVGFLLVGSTGQADAQFFQGGGNPANQTPTLSPYLNMARPGAPGLNYFGLVRPQVDTAKQMLFMQQQQQMQQQLGYGQLGMFDDGTGTAGANVAVTGHQTTYFNYSHYFGQAGGNVAPMAPPPGINPAQKR
jgi:hypothetical protein